MAPKGGFPAELAQAFHAGASGLLEGAAGRGRGGGISARVKRGAARSIGGERGRIGRVAAVETGGGVDVGGAFGGTAERCEGVAAGWTEVVDTGAG